MQRLNAQTQEIFSKHWQKSKITREAFRLSNLNNRLTLLVFMMEDQNEIQKLLLERAANTERITTLVALLDRSPGQPEEKRLLAVVKSKRAPYINTYKRALAMLVKEGKREEARRIMTRETLPLLVAYHDAWNAFYQYQSDDIATAMAKNKADFAIGQQQFLLMVGVAGLITLAIAAFTVWRTGREIAERKVRTHELQWKTAFLEAQVNSSVDGILVIDQEGKMSLQNQRFVELLEIPQHILDEEDDKNRFQWVTDRTKDPKQFVEKVLHLYAHPSEISRDEIELKDGKILDRYSSPVVGEDGEYYGRIWTFRDITERRRAENALRESEDRFSGAFEHAPIGVALVSPEGQWLKVNQALCDLVGYSEAELQTRTFMDLTPPEDVENSRENIRRTIAGEPVPIQIEKNYVHKDGHFITCLLNVSLVRDAQGEPRYFVAQIQDVTERNRASRLLMESQQRLALATESAHIGIWDWDVVANKLVWDAQMYELYGIREHDFSGAYDAWQKGLYPADRERGDAAIHTALDGTKDFNMEFRVVWPDGELRDIEAHAIVQHAADGSATRMTGVNWDITARKRLEGQLLQSQKMETVGKLAGGVAHEFNSILTAIIGQTELLLADLPSESSMARNATEISKAANRAATLTRQLLAYGRKQLLQPETINLNQVVTSMEGMFHHIMGEDVDTQIISAANLHLVKADAGQLEHVIMNMAMNARDAMPHGGKLTLETSNVSFEQESLGHSSELKPGDYVMLAITDTGEGMSEEVKARAFEPFFSTKGVGEGVGLGLSTSYGIVKQSNGHITVYSERGHGTTFKIYLPRVQAAAALPIRRLDVPDLPRGTETILLVEDDPALREMAANLLRRLGYTILTAADGVAALNLRGEEDFKQIDLLFTDIVMPHMSGKELAERVHASCPDARILFTSAYTENAIIHQGVLGRDVALLQKPFTPSALARKLREVLDGPSSDSRSRSDDACLLEFAL